MEANMQSEVRPDYPLVGGEPYLALPSDLFIPPDALWVLLSSFDGPLDLLFYLIKKQNIDVLDIPVALITKQYLAYIQWMESHQLDLASEYLLMAAMLTEIKSRMLLPKRVSEDEDILEEDPRAELVRKLQAYEQMKAEYDTLNTLARVERENYPVKLVAALPDNIVLEPDVSLETLAQLFKDVLVREKIRASHQITREVLSVKDRIGAILQQFGSGEVFSFIDCYYPEEGRLGVVVSFLAILELARRSMLVIEQKEAFSSIYLRLIPHDGYFTRADS